MLLWYNKIILPHRLRKATSLLAVVLAAISLFATVWTVLPAPTYLLWLFSVGATEGSLWFGILGLVAAVLGIAAWRGGAARSGRFSLAGGLVAASLSLLPLLQSLPVASRFGVRLSFAQYFGIHCADSGDPPVEKSTELYTVADGQSLYADRYRAIAAANSVQPGLIVVHGGSWKQGDRSDFSRWDRYLAARGYTVFDIDYRVSPAPNWQTALADVRTAVEWVRTNAAADGVAPDRISLLGRSAGGQLALMATYTEPPGHVAAVVSLYGPTDLVWGYDNVSWPDVISARPTLARYLGGPLATAPRAYMAASPVLAVKAQSPPTLLIHGGRDGIVSPRHALFLAARLGSARSEVVIVPYALHGFDFDFDGWGSQIERPVLLHFLKSTGNTTLAPITPKPPRKL